MSEQPPIGAAAQKVREAVDPLTEFLRDEAAGGIALAIATVVALVWANSSFGDDYVAIWDTQLTLGLGSAALTLDLGHWVNDGLMAIFFFVVGLEIKRELVCGELRDRRAATLPVMAAVGGVVLLRSSSRRSPSARPRPADGRSRPPRTSPSRSACSRCWETGCPQA